MAGADNDDKGKKGITSWASGDGSFKRQVSSFRDAIEKGGKFEPEKDRYHLYVSLACPWAHRALIVRELKGLAPFIAVSTVHPHMLEGGWHFVPKGHANDSPATAHDNDSFPAATEDKLYGSKMMSDLYFKAEPNYSARYTVPVIWDTKTETIVSNESSEIIRFLNTGFNDAGLLQGKEAELDLYPKELRKEIDELNEWVYNDVNNGVYKSGFATKQEAYEEAVTKLQAALERLDGILEGKEFLVGDRLTEADVRLYTTIVRYDPVYHGHFKCNTGSIRHDYPNINLWLRRLYWNYPAFKDTTNFDHIKEHYYYSHAQINPTRIVPHGPIPNIEPLDDAGAGAGQKRAAEQDDGANKKSK